MRGLSLAVSGSYCRVVVRQLLFGVASLAMEHRLEDRWDSVVVVIGLSCHFECGTYLTRNQTHVPCTSRQILNLWTTRKASPDKHLVTHICCI